MQYRNPLRNSSLARVWSLRGRSRPTIALERRLLKRGKLGIWVEAQSSKIYTAMVSSKWLPRCSTGARRGDLPEGKISAGANPRLANLEPCRIMKVIAHNAIDPHIINGL